MLVKGAPAHNWHLACCQCTDMSTPYKHCVKSSHRCFFALVNFNTTMYNKQLSSFVYADLNEWLIDSIIFALDIKQTMYFHQHIGRDIPKTKLGAKLCRLVLDVCKDRHISMISAIIPDYSTRYTLAGHKIRLDQFIWHLPLLNLFQRHPLCAYCSLVGVASM